MLEAGSSQSSKTNERKETKIIPITKGKEVVKCNACFKIKRKDDMKNHWEKYHKDKGNIHIFVQPLIYHGHDLKLKLFRVHPLC